MSNAISSFTALIRAIEANDGAAVRHGFAPEAVIWHNTSQIDQGRDEIVEVVKGLHANFTDVSYEIIEVLTTSAGAVGRIVLRCTAPDGDPVVMAACMIMAVDAGGRITRVDEYLDSAASVRRKVDLDAPVAR